VTWDEIINDPSLRDLPFKIETNKFGQTKGALEVWIVSGKNEVTFYTHTGKLKKSRLVPKMKF
jgi:hypothetical protein